MLPDTSWRLVHSLRLSWGTSNITHYFGPIWFLRNSRILRNNQPLDISLCFLRTSKSFLVEKIGESSDEKGFLSKLLTHTWVVYSNSHLLWAISKWQGKQTPLSASQHFGIYTILIHYLNHTLVHSFYFIFILFLYWSFNIFFHLPLKV